MKIGPAELNAHHRAFWDPLCARVLRSPPDVDTSLAYELAQAASRAGDVNASVFVEMWKLDQLRNSLIDPVEHFRRRVSSVIGRRAASAPRKPGDPLNLAIEVALTNDPKLTAAALERVLRRNDELTFNDEVIEYVRGKRTARAEISGLKDRISTIRRRLRKELARAG